jgi:hypothetical protein
VHNSTRPTNSPFSIDGRHSNKRRPQQPPNKQFRMVLAFDGCSAAADHAGHHRVRHIARQNTRICLGNSMHAGKFAWARLHMPQPHRGVIVSATIIPHNPIPIRYATTGVPLQHKTVPLGSYFATLFGDWQTSDDPLFVIMRHYAKPIVEAMTLSQLSSQAWTRSSTSFTWTSLDPSSTEEPTQPSNADRKHCYVIPNPFSDAPTHPNRPNK